MARPWIVFLLGLLWTTAATAAHVFTAHDGLPQNAVMALARDGEGFLWVGTEQGLARFDGEHFRRLPGLPDDNISALLAENRVLWVGSYGGGVSRVELDSGRIDVLGAAGGLPSPFIQDIARDSNGALWVGSDGGGLAWVDWQAEKPGEIHAFRAAADGSEGLPSDRVWSLQRGPSGIWASTLGGLALVRNGASEPHRVSIPAPFPRDGKVNIEQVLEQPDGVLWIATWDEGLYRWQQRTGVVERFAPGDPRAQGLPSTRITALASEPDGRLWVGTDRGVAQLEPTCDCLRGIELPLRGRDDSDGLFVVSLNVDNHGGVWLGTYGEGLVRLSPETRLFERQRHRRGDSDSVAQGRVRALTEDHAGTLWVGSVGGGLQSVDAVGRIPGQPWHFVERDPVSANSDPHRRYVWTILEDRSRRLWLGSDAGLDVLDPAREHWRHVPVEGAIGSNIRVLFEDSHSALWIGSSTGLAVLRGDSVQRVPFDTDDQWGVQDRTVQALAEDGLGRIWVGSVGGLHVLDAEGHVLRRFRSTAGADGPQGSIFALLMQLDGSLWVGGSRGLCISDARADINALRWRCLDDHAALPHRTVYSLAAGNDGGVWLGTVAGLVRVDPSDLSVRLHAGDDGMIGDEFAPGAVASGRDGHLYFGASGGFLGFDPRRLRAPDEPEKVWIASFTLNNEELVPRRNDGDESPLQTAFPYAKHLDLGHYDRVFGFRLTALDFDRAEQLNYSYRLVGLDQDWLLTGSPPQVSYTGVPPGDYRLEVRVRAPGHDWSTPQTVLDLSIAPAFWNTAGFQFGALLVGLLLAWGAYRWRLGALARRSLWLEAEVTQRTMDLEAQKSELASAAQALRDANARLYELSTRDALTGVFNRRHALEEAGRMLAQADREGCHLVMALIDLDHFKRLNDEYGHLAGDRALAEFGRLLRDSLESPDMAGRYGGEEFLCILGTGGLARARAWAQTLVERIAVGGLLWQGRVLQLTVSIGLAEREPGDGLLDAWIARSDAALYRAKHAGRNRVESAPN